MAKSVPCRNEEQCAIFSNGWQLCTRSGAKENRFHTFLGEQKIGAKKSPITASIYLKNLQLGYHQGKKEHLCHHYDGSTLTFSEDSRFFNKRFMRTPKLYSETTVDTVYAQSVASNYYCFN